MSFIWPPLLLLLLTIPVGVALYGTRERRRTVRAAKFGMGSAAARSTSSPTPTSRRIPWSRFSRRIPAVATILGVAVLVISLARPQSVIGVPRLEGTVLLAFDVSGSMAAPDVAPSRMEAAKTAALAFADKAPTSVRIGVVAFSESGISTQAPTGDRGAVTAAIARLEPQRGTSIAQGILASLDAIQTDADPRKTDYYLNASAPPTPVPTAVPTGVHQPAIIVLLTDGENTAPPEPLAAARLAKDRGVRIDTIGVGSEAGTTIQVEGFQIHTQLDRSTLETISAMTDGTYHAAATGEDLTAIYEDIGRRLVVRSEPFELTPIFAALGFVLLVAGGLGSLRRFGRMP